MPGSIGRLDLAYSCHYISSQYCHSIEDKSQISLLHPQLLLLLLLLLQLQLWVADTLQIEKLEKESLWQNWKMENLQKFLSSLACICCSSHNSSLFGLLFIKCLHETFFSLLWITMWCRDWFVFSARIEIKSLLWLEIVKFIFTWIFPMVPSGWTVRFLWLTKLLLWKYSTGQCI